jgi:hypothetical protein
MSKARMQQMLSRQQQTACVSVGSGIGLAPRASRPGCRPAKPSCRSRRRQGQRRLKFKLGPRHLVGRFKVRFIGANVLRGLSGGSLG